MEIKVLKDIDELSRQFAEWMVSYIKQVLKNKDRFTIALSGGSTPKKLYRLLATDSFKTKIDWSKIHFFWGDERYVPFTDDRNNAKMAFDELLDHVPVVKEQIHVMRTDMEPEASASAYEKILHHYFPDSNHTFDLVLLGIGDNAHTLSLFPGNAIINEKKEWVKAVYIKELHMNRITLTAPIVNAAGCVSFLVSGSDKAAALFQIITKEYNPELYPAQVIQPYNDELYWWIDKTAAIELK